MGNGLGTRALGLVGSGSARDLRLFLFLAIFATFTVYSGALLIIILITSPFRRPSH